jgi:ABC-type multidrug transport system ATPase subunit
LYSGTTNTIIVGTSADALAASSSGNNVATYAQYFSSNVWSNEASSVEVNPSSSSSFTTGNSTVDQWSRYILDRVQAVSHPLYATVYMDKYTNSTRSRMYIMVNYAMAPDIQSSAVSLVENVVWRGSTQLPTACIQGYNHPLNKPSTLYSDDSTIIANVIFTTLVLVGFGLIPQFFGLYVVKEKMDRAKHLQLLSGVDYFTYWFASLTWDFINFLIPAACFIILLLIFTTTILVAERIAGTILLCILYAPALASFSYFLVQAFDFESPDVVQRVINAINFLFGLFLYEVITVMSNIDDAQDSAYYMANVFRALFPSFTFADAIDALSTIAVSNQLSIAQQYWYDWPVIGRSLMWFGAQTLFYFTATVALEYVRASKQWQINTYSIIAACLNCSCCKQNNVVNEEIASDKGNTRATVATPIAGSCQDMVMDADVKAERERVQSGAAHQDAIVIQGLRKVYGDLTSASSSGTGPGWNVAVNDLWFGIPQGQCFGFLGVNGAGKSTTMKILCGDEIATKGTASLAGLDILQFPEQVRRLIGYCPQFDALLPLLSPFEHLELYARIKSSTQPGILGPHASIDDMVMSMIRSLALEDFAHKPAVTLSGGNRRKLSVGIALLGSPPIVFLDELSTGMDPKARRFIWSLISSTMKNRAMILTTHMMEECEALCSRIGIMIAGNLSCIGSSQHLRSKFGNSYQVEVKLKNNDVNVNDCANVDKVYELNAESSPSPDSKTSFEDLELFKLMRSQFPDFTLLENQGKVFFKFQVKKVGGITLSQMFKVIENAKQVCGIDYYSISETDLEYIFIRMAKMAKQKQERFGMSDETIHVQSIESSLSN